MEERPLLRLPTPIRGKADRKRGRAVGPKGPGRERQKERLAPRFDRLARAIDENRIDALRDDPDGIAPERALVFEVVGNIGDFIAAAQRIGLAYEGEIETEIEADDDFFVEDKEGRKPTVAARLYLTLPDEQAVRQLVRLWRLFCEGRRLPPGFGDWREVFLHLRDLRPWGPQDRLPEDAKEILKRRLAEEPGKHLRVEAELWLRRERERGEARDRVRRVVEADGGHIRHECLLPDIRYHGLLLEVPPAAVRKLLEGTSIPLLRCDDVMVLRPQSVLRAPLAPEEEPAAPPEAADAVPPAETPRGPMAALFDGMPMQNHARLQGRLVIDDPDGVEARSLVQARRHGTAMASLILHGDLARPDGGGTLDTSLHVRPVLIPMGPNGRACERTDPDRLVVDTIWRAVGRMKRGEGSTPPVAPDVVFVNLSLGDESRPFAGLISPLARAIDHLAWTHRLLFLISAGNIADTFPLDGHATWGELEDLSPEERETIRAARA
ncbi:MAG: hypothetical protein RML45_10360 [Acetobacteraceae bacterium]|nr:hypothetical protein [Acetobacteraceae bacterium]